MQLCVFALKSVCILRLSYLVREFGIRIDFFYVVVYTSGSLDPSHVLLAMGLSLPEALGSLRLTVGPATTEADLERALQALSGIGALA